jgi:hypothetical protein
LIRTRRKRSFCRHARRHHHHRDKRLTSDGELLDGSTSRAVAVGDWTGERDDLLAALYEHEVMHEGQIIRHLYALERRLPGLWRWA